MSLRSLLLPALVAAGLFPTIVAADPGTAFSVQGELRDGGSPAVGAYDFQLALFAGATGGTALDTVGFENAAVEAGQFELEPDFTAVPFETDAPMWVEVRVREGASTGAYATLQPRQRLTPVPYALRASGVADAAIDTAALATNAVGSAKIAPGAVGAAQIDSAQVQRRIGGCGAGQVVQAIAADGTPTCVAASTIASVSAGTGLSGGGSSGALTLSIATNGVGSTQIADGGIATVDLGPGVVTAAKIDATQVQRRLVACPAGTALQSAAADGSVTCLSPGTITGVTAGTGLAGGGSNGNVALSIAASGVGSTQVADGSIATIDLGPAVVTAAKIDTAQVQRRITGTCPAGSAVSGVNADGSVACDARHAAPAPAGSAAFLPGIAGGTSSVVGEDGLVFVAAHDAANGRLLGVHCNDAACSAPVVNVIDSGNVGAYPSVTLVDGLPAIAYRDTANTAAKLALCGNAACSSATLRTLDATGDVGEWTQIGVNFVGFPVVAYYDRSNGDLKAAFCQSLSCAGSTVTTLDTGAGADVGQALSSMTIDQRLILGYHDVTANRFKVTTCSAGGSCGNTVTAFVDAAGSGSTSAITVTTAGLPRLFWRRGNTTQTALCLDITCTVIGAPSTYNARSYATMAATLDRWGHPITLGIYESNGVDQAEVMRCTDPACSSSTLQRAFNFGNTDMDAPVSMVLGANGNPVYTLRSNTQTVLQVCATSFCNLTLRR